MNKKILLFSILFLLLTIGVNDVFACSGADCDTIKALFSATEVESYTGSPSSPTTAVFWTQANCPGSATFPYSIPSGYSLTSCTSGTTGTHGGCPSCKMSKISLTKSGGTSCTSSCSTPVNGQCGSSNGQTLTSKPASNLCSKGSASSVSGSGPWNWTCSGSNGGATVSCSANKQSCSTTTNGQCGSSNGQSLTSAPTSNLCSKGSASGVSGSGPWNWTCSGSNGGATVSCSASKAAVPTNGDCGSSHRQSFTSAPTSNLCDIGNMSGMSGSGPWRWYCSGINGGATVACTADKKTITCNGAFGSSNYVQYNGGGNGTIHVNVSNLGVQPSALEVRWGLNSVLTTNDVKAWVPITSTGNHTIQMQGLEPNKTYYVVVSLSSTGCMKDGPLMTLQTTEVVAVNGQCGSANGQSFTSKPTSNLCNAGSASSVSGSGPWNWTCSGSNGGATVSCSANKTATPVNGQCGSSNGQTITSKPTSNLCSKGSASSVSGSGPWNWSCSGQNGGTNAYCTAYKTYVNRNPIVDAGTNKDVNEGQSVYMNASASDPDGDSLTYSWTCTGGTLSSYSILNPTYYAPNVSCNTTYTCTLTVNDGHGGSASDSVSILVRNTTVVINGQCGSANGQSFTSKPTSNLCNAGSASSVSGSGPWNWTCSGQNGGATVSCSANKQYNPNPVDGQCGSANGQSFTSKPTSNLCYEGDASSVSGSGPWYWSCYGEDGGDNASCTAYKTHTNRDPIVDAGPDKNINEGSSVKIYATASDPDGDTLTYSWSCTGGSLSSYSILSPTYYAPNVSYDTTYTCTITVSDDDGGVASDSLNILVRSTETSVNGQCGSANGQSFTSKPTSNLCYQGDASSVSGSGPWNWTCYGEDGGSDADCVAYRNQVNRNPIINIGPSKEVPSGQSVYLSVTAYDPDGDTLSYSWSCNGGYVSSSSILSPTYFAPHVSSSVTYNCSLTVTDDRGGSAYASVNIFVRADNNQYNNNPVVDAGPSRDVESGESVYLNATAYDPDGDYLTYSWDCNGGYVSPNSSLNATYHAPTVYSNTTYTCTLTATDDDGRTGYDSVNILVRSYHDHDDYDYNTNPYVDAGSNKDVQSGQSVYMNATANDPNGDYLTYSWTCNGGTLSSYSILNPTYTAPYVSYNTTYTCTLYVNDNRGGSSSDTVNMYVKTGTIYSNASVTTNNATSVTTTTARMNGYLSEDGGENTSVRFNWGRIGSFANNSSWIDYKRAGDYFFADAYGLEKGKAYQFRAEAKNSRGTVNGSTLKFITRPDSPSYFNATLINTYQIRLDWGIGQGACYTSVVRKLNSYPATVTDGMLVYYGSGTSYTDDVSAGNTYYYRAWSVACDADMYALSDSLYSKDFVTIYKPSTPVTPVTPVVPVVESKCRLDVDVLGRNLTQGETSWDDSVSAQPGEEVEIMINVTALECNASNVILTNILPVKIDDVYDVKGEGQTFCGDASGSFILGTINKDQTKSIVFKMKLSGDESFTYGTMDLTDSAEANAKNIETTRDNLDIRVSKETGEEAMAGLSGFISRNWKIFYLFLGLLLGLIIFLLILFYLRESDRRKRLKEENMVLEKSKYFHIQ